MKKILLLIVSLTSLAFMQDECSDFLTEDDCLSSEFCQWLSDTPSAMNGMCVEFNNDNWDDSCDQNIPEDDCGTEGNNVFDSDDL